MESSQQDLEIIKRSQSGDMAAFRELVRAHEGWLRAWLRSQLSDWTAADDLAQDTFVTAFLKIRDFRGEGSLEAWLRKISYNHFRNYLRKKREKYVGSDLELQALLVVEDANDLMRSNASIDALRDCLSHVKGPASKLLNEHYVVGKTLREISKETETGYSALTMKLHRIRQSLAECIEGKLSKEGI